MTYFIFYQDIKNNYDDGSGEITFHQFCEAMEDTNQESDDETFFKETFRTFSKDEEGCIPPEEMRFVFQYLGVIKLTFNIVLVTGVWCPIMQYCSDSLW